MSPADLWRGFLLAANKERRPKQWFEWVILDVGPQATFSRLQPSPLLNYTLLRDSEPQPPSWAAPGFLTHRMYWEITHAWGLSHCDLGWFVTRHLVTNTVKGWGTLHAGHATLYSPTRLHFAPNPVPFFYFFQNLLGKKEKSDGAGNTHLIRGVYRWDTFQETTSCPAHPSSNPPQIIYLQIRTATPFLSWVFFCLILSLDFPRCFLAPATRIVPDLHWALNKYLLNEKTNEWMNSRGPHMCYLGQGWLGCLAKLSPLALSPGIRAQAGREGEKRKGWIHSLHWLWLMSWDQEVKRENCGLR